MGSTCNTCNDTKTTFQEATPDKINEFSKEIQLLISELRKKYDKQITEATEVSLGNGKIFKGRFKSGKKTGYGEYFHDGTVFFGVYEDNLANGEGLLVTDFKNYIKSTFENGIPNGQTKQRINLNFFHGQYRQGKKSKGILTTDEFLYEGSFRDDKFHGYGILEFENGDKYEGDFCDGLYHGDGVYESRQNGTYKGEFKNGVYEGKGVFLWANGNLYKGEYKDGLRNGPGKLIMGEDQYEGTWVAGKLPNQKPKQHKNRSKTEQTTGSDLAGYVIQLF